MKNKITFIGSGAMATAMAKVGYDSGTKDIKIYGVDKKELNDLKNGFNSKHFPITSKIPKFQTTSNLKEALEGATHIVFAVPSQFIEKVVNDVINNLNKQVTFINMSKGFFPNSDKSIHNGIKNLIKNNDLVKGIVSLVGPSHAEEIVNESLTLIAAVDTNVELVKEVQNIFFSPYFKTCMQNDVIGSGVGAIYKNVLAIASGMVSGLGYGINTTAALLSRGIAEAQRYNEFVGGKPETIMGLTCFGDLIVTAMSDSSRNFTFGKQFILDKEKALNSKATVEGLTGLKILYRISKENNLNLPIINFLHKIIKENIDPWKIINEFWSTFPELE